jgi:Recombinase
VPHPSHCRGHLQHHVVTDDSVGLQLRQRLSCLRRQLLKDGVLGTQPDFGRIHRAAISRRTRDALAAKRARGERLGAAPALPMQITRRIIAERGNGRTFQAIAEGLMADGVPTAGGKTRWYAATIKAMVTSDNAAALA